MLVGGCCDEAFSNGHRSPTHANCRKPALERLARHSLFDRYMKAQLRLTLAVVENSAETDSGLTYPESVLTLPNICATCATLNTHLGSPTLAASSDSTEKAARR